MSDVTRRRFLHTSAGAAAALAASDTLLAAPAPPRIVVASGGEKMDPDKGAYTRLKAALAKHGGFDALVRGKKVLVKTNATDGKSQDANTSPEATAAILKLCGENGAKSIKVIGQEWGGFTCKRKGRPTLGEVIKAAGAELQELTHWWLKSSMYVKKVPKTGGWKELWVAKDIFEPDTVLINIARLKTHAFTIYTGAVKNCIGLTFHMYAHHCTSDLNPAAGKSDKHPDRLAGWKLFPGKLAGAYNDVYRHALALNILDAGEPTFGWGGPKPERIHTFPAHRMIVGLDAMALDAYGCQLLHEKRPKDIPTALADWTQGDGPYVKSNASMGNYLAECQKLGAGQADIAKVTVDEVKIS
ncbi:DUF362 domain-containing protein [bacterium]|nr:DUF362 domain-containing protein [bacterium]